MKKIVLFAAIIQMLLTFTSCEEGSKILEDLTLSEEDVVLGLKTALEVGTDTSTTLLGATNGYLKDEAVKILLPPEAEILRTNLDNQYLKTFGVTDFIYNRLDSMVLRMNRAAENSAALDKTKDIFVDAITGMSFEQAWDILNGVDVSKHGGKDGEPFDSLAATHFFMSKSFEPLKSLFSPVVEEVMGQPLVGSVSCTQAWNDVTQTYNNLINKEVLLGQTVSDLTGYEPVERNLGEYVTQKALDGLFLKIGEEERKIRRDPYQWALDILHKVFGGE